MFDLDLARQLSRPGPRYTSYPTAPHLHGEFGSEEHAIALSGTGGRPISLYVHIPFCAKLCNYCGCHMQVTHRPEKISRYLRYLFREIDLVAARLGKGSEVVQVHWGGGTPNSLAPEQIEELMAHLRHRFPISPQAEIGLEGDPRTLTREHLASAVRAGFTRLSLGVQSFDPVVQEAIGRVQPFETVAGVVARARYEGIAEVGFDLLYGLPHQTPARFADTVARTIALRPDRVSVFGYAHVPWMKPHQRLIPTHLLPGPEERLALFALAHERLTDAGYVAVGMDHFARPDDPLAIAQEAGTLHRTFQGYTTHAGTDLVGLGVSAVSMFDRAYAQNVKGLPPYYAAVNAGRLPTERGLSLTDEDVLRRDVIGQLMCNFTLDRAAVEERFGISFADHFADAFDTLAELEALGVAVVGPERIEVTERGRPFVRNVAMAFDAYLPKQSPSAPRYSQTV
jgi:oxygen-independent coproporphyrinogen III oxidase